ncbi:MAG: CCA tRNA nucleotidyltransferase [Bryobacteraceae bacterium]
MPPSELAARIVAALRARGHQAWLVGGCVRDLLLGRDAQDFDVATGARPDEILELFPKADRVGAHFGVVLVRQDGAQVEVATFRSDFAYTDGRRPDSVRFEADPAQDARRRDFTVNALFMDPFSGAVLDFAGGREDLARGIIRAIGDPEARFREDHLRLLRAVRFAARLGFEIEPGTLQAIRQARAEIHTVAAERVRDELNRILTEGGARRGFELLDETGLLTEILPEVAAMKGVAQPPEFHPEGDVWTHTLMLLKGLEQPAVTLAWGALLHDVGKPPAFRVAGRIRFDGHVEAGVAIARRILTRLRFSKDEYEQIVALVANHMRFKDAAAMRASTLKRFLRLPRFDEHLELHRLDCRASNGCLETYDFVRRKLAEFPAEQIKPAPLVTGRDLIAAGYAPGPLFAGILASVEDAQLEGAVGNREEALEFVRRRFGDPTRACS